MSGEVPAIVARDVTKSYGKVAALQGVTLTVAPGMVFGLLGPNGAGKSTLIKALVGALRPSGGVVRVLGLDPLCERAALREVIGFMPQAPALYNDLSALANVAFFGRAHAPRLPSARVDAVLKMMDLASRAHDPVRTFSGGMQRRVSLACALVHQPRMLFLDEPTAAVDPVLRARLWRTFRELASTGVTLFISTHLMDEALLCDQVAVLRAGKVLVCDSPTALLERGHTRLTIQAGTRADELVIGSQPASLASALHSFGLATDVTSVRVQADSLETIVFGMVASEDSTGDAEGANPTTPQSAIAEREERA